MPNTKKKDEQETPQAPAATNEAGADSATEAEHILAQAKAEADKILSDAKAQAAEAPRGAATTDPGEELVPIRLFKDNDKYKDDVFVAVNGERVQIKRGETVRIKRKFADVLEQSMRQDVATANMIERESASFERKAAELNI